MKWEKDKTDIKPIKDAITNENELSEVIKNYSRNPEGIAIRASLDIEKLKRILHEWKLFKKARKLVEIEVLSFFDRKRPETTFAVSEIKKEVKASEPSIQRALKNLVKKGLLTRPGRGTYRRSF